MSVGIRCAKLWAPGALSPTREWRFVEPYSLIDFATAFQRQGGKQLGKLKVQLPSDATKAERDMLLELGAEIL